MHLRYFVFALAIVALSTVAFSQPLYPIPQAPGPSGELNPGALFDAFQVNYIPNPTNVSAPGGNVLNMTNAGELGACKFGPAGCAADIGDICANIYVFQSDEELEECCYCQITPNALVHLSASDLIGNPGNGVSPTNGVVIKIVTTVAASVGTGGVGPGKNNANPAIGPYPAYQGSKCNPAQDFHQNNLAPGGRYWGTKTHQLTVTPVSWAITETAFLPALLSEGELDMMTNLCRFQVGNGSGAGVCKNCVPSSGALGGSRQ